MKLEPSGTPADQLPAVNQSDDTAPVQVLWALAGDAASTVTTPTIADVPKKAARPAGAGYSRSDDRCGLDNLFISNSRTFDHRWHWIAKFRGRRRDAPPKRHESLLWIFDPRCQHNGFRCEFRAHYIFDFSGQII
jgi:hypothetical protein